MCNVHTCSKLEFCSAQNMETNAADAHNVGEDATLKKHTKGGRKQRYKRHIKSCVIIR